MICSFIPGRVRFRSARLKDPETISTLTSIIREQAGVIKVESNLVTGSLLVLYDPDEVDQESVLAAMSLLPDEEEQPPRSGLPVLAVAWGKQNKKATEYLFMIGALVVCTSSGFLRAKGLHIYSGLTLVGLTVQHIWTYRDKLKKMISGPKN